MRLTFDSNLDELGKIMLDAGRDMPVIFSRSVNTVARRTKTLAIREVKEAGGFKNLRYVREKTKLWLSSRATMTAELNMTSSWSTVAAHNATPQYKSPRGGNPMRRAKPWGERQHFARGFWVAGKSGNRLPVQRVGKGRGAYRVMYGANPARELQRADANEPVQRYIDVNLPREIVRYGKVYLDAKAARLGR